MFRHLLASAYRSRKQLAVVSSVTAVAVVSAGAIACDEGEVTRIHLWLWGDNKANTVKYSKNEYFNRPKSNSFFDKPLRSVAFGPGLSVGVDQSGNVYGWGSGFGKDVTSSRQPKLLLKGANITEVKCTDSHVFSLSKSGNVYVTNPKADTVSVGWIFSSQDALVSNPTRSKITKIDAGEKHVLALTGDGSVLSCASAVDGNKMGQLGIGSTQLCSSDKEDIKNGKFSFAVVPHTTKTIDIACGLNHNVLMDRHNKVYSWGSDYYMQLCQGKSDEILQPSPAPIKMPSKMTRSDSTSVGADIINSSKQDTEVHMEVFKVGAGGDNTVILRKDENIKDSFELLIAGHGQNGSLGSGAYTHARGMLYPVNILSRKTVYNPETKVESAWGVKDIQIGNGHMYALMSDNDVYCWGLNSTGQLGLGKICNVPKPVLVLSDTPGLGSFNIPWDAPNMKIALGCNNTAIYKRFVA